MYGKKTCRRPSHTLAAILTISTTPLYVMYETPFGYDITVIALRKAISTGFESSFFSTRSDIQQKWEKMKSETI